MIVRLDLRAGRTPTITVTDDGEGMSLDIVQNVWLVPGDDYRDKQRKAKKRSEKHHRLPLGEKGLGRFAVHKLGDHIELVTRAANAEECVVEIVWSDLIAQEFLGGAPVRMKVREPEEFKGR